MKNILIFCFVMSYTFGHTQTESATSEFDIVAKEIIDLINADDYTSLSSYIPDTLDIMSMRGSEFMKNKRTQNMMKNHVKFQNDIRVRLQNDFIKVSQQLKSKGFKKSHIKQVKHKFRGNGQSSVVELICDNGSTMKYSIFISPIFKWNNEYRLWDSIIVKDQTN